jgi:anti-sigma factor RsiW
MSCAAFERGLGDYVEHALPSDQALRMASHLEQCRSCRLLLGEYRALGPLLRRATHAVLPASARANLRRLVIHAMRRRS